jgi:hypothetical protein
MQKLNTKSAHGIEISFCKDNKKYLKVNYVYFLILVVDLIWRPGFCGTPGITMSPEDEDRNPDKPGMPGPHQLIFILL